SARASGAYLRSVLHHQSHRARNRSRPVDLVRDHPGTRRGDRVRQQRRPGHSLHVVAAIRGCAGAAQQRPGLIRNTMATSRSGTVLVVEDEEIMREILETLLTREGYEVRLAASGSEGLELARALPFDAAIVDIMMPGLDGIATLDELKRIDEDLAVIIIT